MAEVSDNTHQDPRIAQAIDLIRTLAKDTSDTRVAVTIASLQSVNIELQENLDKTSRINHLMELMLKYTLLDYSERAPLSERGDEIDALAAGLNALVEEMQYSSQFILDKVAQLNEAQRLAHIGSWEWHVPSNTIEWSDELVRIYGLNPNDFEASYENYLSIIHPDDVEQVNAAVQQAYENHEPFAFVHKILRGNEERVLDCTGFVTTDDNGNILRMTGTAQDITERRSIEEEKLKAENEKQTAVDALRYKQQFLSNMSHEIRTPLTAIIGFTKVVMKSELDERQREYINAIKVSSDALLVLVNDILDLAKVNAGKMTFDEIPFRLDSTIKNMLLLFETKVKQKNIALKHRFDSAIPENLSGDPARLNQIILNLVSNAVKFTSEGEISVDVRLKEKTDEGVRLSFCVTDTGIGISPENLDRIFDSFQQASSETSRVFGGTGLGLAIVKQLVEAQGGTITVRSALDLGSEFCFELFFRHADANHELLQQQKEEEDFYAHDNEINILVVEDVALNQLLMKVVLSNLGFKPHIANNGKEAIDMLQTNQYDIVLMDLHMPIMDGFQATEHIRNVLKSDIPIIALTADVTSADIQKSRELGMNDYATKPIDQKKLFAKITTILKEFDKIPKGI